MVRWREHEAGGWRERNQVMQGPRERSQEELDSILWAVGKEAAGLIPRGKRKKTVEARLRFILSSSL